ncbi:MAG: molybdopterin molybdotransferase MoeA [Kangiellaceae bacterium]|nr:molybdopterin molybdotransferase MoeA [Kangiellaceae bacterium]
MSCCDVPGLMPVEQAIERLLSQVQPVTDVQMLPLAKALGKVLAKEQYSSINVPAFNNSAMDGYAVKLSSLSTTNKLPISQRIIAGDPADQPLREGTCARIFTGAPIPDNCDAVVMQEQCEVMEEGDNIFIQFPSDIKPQQNIRPLGQDIQMDQVVLESGKQLRAQELGLLASVGIKEIPVYRPLKIAVLSTGNEIIEPGTQIKAGQIYNSNHYTIIGLLQSHGFEVYDCGTVVDDAQKIEAALLDAADNSDCIITSGGVSVGEEDYVKNRVEKLGRLELWKIAIKPGKPFAFGYVKETPFIGLPGNPSAVFATFNIVAKPYLLSYQGMTEVTALSYKAKANFTITKPAIREQYLYVKAVNKDGLLWLEKYPNQSSGVLSSSAWSNGFAKIPVNTCFEQGDEIDFIPF